MSWSGFYQVLCINGHSHSRDGYDYGYLTSDWKCPDCGEKMAWQRLVDQTNPCEYDNCELPEEQKEICKEWGCGYIKLEEKTPGEYKICNLGFTHCVKPATYVIPEDVGHLIKEE